MSLALTVPGLIAVDASRLGEKIAAKLSSTEATVTLELSPAEAEAFAAVVIGCARATAGEEEVDFTCLLRGTLKARKRV